MQSIEPEIVNKSVNLHRRLGWRFVSLLWRTIFRLFFKLEIRGRNNIPNDRKFILASNHQSNFDPPLIGSFFPRELYFVAKKQLFSNPIMGILLRWLNAISIDRGGADLRAMRKIKSTLNSGHDLLVFPEGHRSIDGDLRSPRKGVGMIADSVKCDILPLAISGSYQKPGFIIGRPQLIVEYGKPIDFTSISASEIEQKNEINPSKSEHYQLIADRIMNEISILYKNIRI
jgi:1-acyl-sn-glycerol-3-phosphate acyltransferase